jgi:hypothetical protein
VPRQLTRADVLAFRVRAQQLDRPGRTVPAGALSAEAERLAAVRGTQLARVDTG